VPRSHWTYGLPFKELYLRFNYQLIIFLHSQIICSVLCRAEHKYQKNYNHYSRRLFAEEKRKDFNEQAGRRNGCGYSRTPIIPSIFFFLSQG